MKKIFAILLSFISLSATAGQTVPIVWPFAVGAQQANFIRAIVEQANQDQSKYTFVFENKPGAGGTVAARYIQSYKGVAILSSSSSFWVRPQFYPNESYDNQDFKPVLIECVGQPYSIMSAKYRSIEEIRQQKELSIGVILGSLTEANARQLQKILPDTKLNFIGYQGTHQPTQEMLAGVLDLSVDLPADSMPWVELGKLHVIGASGSVEHKNLPTWRSQGIRGFEGLVSNYQMVVRSDLSDLETQEIHGILRRAAQHSPGLSKLYQSDYCTQQDLDLKDSNALYNQWLKYWPEKLKSLR